MAPTKTMKATKRPASHEDRDAAAEAARKAADRKKQAILRAGGGASSSMKKQAAVKAMKAMKKTMMKRRSNQPRSSNDVIAVPRVGRGGPAGGVRGEAARLRMRRPAAASGATGSGDQQMVDAYIPAPRPLSPLYQRFVDMAPGLENELLQFTHVSELPADTVLIAIQTEVGVMAFTREAFERLMTAEDEGDKP